ncbi:recombinase RecQ [Subtercola sp. Z020]|uniref:RecQ family ATP-dependent DNA helicase n=1 Tax=Subtercola sp. Z020 TaxID=2080582 RepID=UPI000CE9089C|nr:RecQ family ATP-dependent DNA helicase [Subtercola sp. Z020]PPF80761.1 recombinase RecQ [Subtercola sp. Z020]
MSTTTNTAPDRVTKAGGPKRGAANARPAKTGAPGIPLSTLDEEIRRTARESFGWKKLRPGLEDAMTALLEGRDVLAIMPTGYGKSSIYEVTGTMFGGVTIVVSPLIALQEDQVRTLEEAPDAPRAVAINSSRGAAANRAAWSALERREARFVFLSPEQLAKSAVRRRLQALPIDLFVVDEAHCVSSWGHDFRPDYLQLGEAIESLGHPPVLAMTATGAAPVRDEIAQKLGLASPLLIARGFDRPNLRYEVRRHESDADKRREVVRHVESLDRPGLVYVATRKDTEKYAAELEQRGIRSAGYNGGMSAKARDEVYEKFMADEVDIVVATSAFGMGIDKPNVRFVVHAAVTDSMDSYYQEVGRAGRDGDAAAVTLHYRPEDFALTSFFGGGEPDRDELERTFAAVRKGPGAAGAAGAAGGAASSAGATGAAGAAGISREELAEALGTSTRSLARVVGLLEDSGAITLVDGMLRATRIAPRTAAKRAIDHAATRSRIEHSRAQMMQEFAETVSCRRQFLLGYFGEQLPKPCGNCDTCASGSAYEYFAEHVEPGHPEPSAGALGGAGDPLPFPVGARVRHAVWGEGQVMRRENDRVTVFFDEQGYKVLSLTAVTEHDLLREEPELA